MVNFIFLKFNFLETLHTISNVNVNKLKMNIIQDIN